MKRTPHRSALPLLRSRATILFPLALALASCDPRATNPTPDAAEIDESLPSVDLEPNDDIETASPLNGDGLGQVAPQDVDFFRLELDQRGSSIVLIATDPAQIRLDAVTSSSYPSQVGASHHVMAIRDDAFLRVVNIGADEISYEIRLVDGPVQQLQPLLLEPNDRSAPERANAFPAAWTGYFDGRRDVDVLGIDRAAAEAFGPLMVNVSPTPGCRSSIAFFDEGFETRLAEVIAVEPGDGVGIPNLGVFDGLGDVVWMEISATGCNDPTNPYTVSLVAAPIVTSDRFELELEPNDNAERPLPIGRREAITGILHQEGDLDRYRVTLESYRAMTVRLQPHGDYNIGLRWIPEDSEAVVVNFGQAGEPEAMCNRDMPSGTYLLEVSGIGVFDPEAPLATYSLWTRQEREDVEREPNESYLFAQLQRLEIGESLRGYIGHENDVDRYGFQIIPSVDRLVGTYTITVRPNNDVLALSLALQDEDGDAVASQPAGQPGEVVRLENDMLGSFIIVVNSVQGASCAGEDGYRISISVEDEDE